MPSVQEVDGPTLASWLADPMRRVRVIDVREDEEFAAERIHGTTLLPLSRFDPGVIPDEAGITVVLHCRSGKRSLNAGLQLLAAGHRQAIHLRGGIEAWKAGGLPVIRG